MKRMNAKGFSAIEALIIVVVIGLIGGAAYFVWQSNNKNEDSTTKTSQAKKTELQKDVTADWLKYTSQNSKFSMAIPDGWHLMSSKGEDDLYAFDSKKIVFKDGTPAKVDAVELGGDGMAFWLVYNYKGNKNFDFSFNLERSEKVKTYTTSNGVAVTKYKFTQTAEPEGQDISKGEVEYLYDLAGKGKSTMITYQVRLGEDDQTQYIEEAIGTLKFL